MKGIAVVYRRDDEYTTCALIEARDFDSLAREARHVGYQHNASSVNLWKLNRKASRRVYVHYLRDDTDGKLKQTCAVRRVTKDELPKLEWVDMYS